MSRSESDIATKEDVRITLKVSRDDARLILKNGILRSEFESIIAVDRRTGEIYKHELSAFHSKYCSLNEIVLSAKLNCANAKSILLNNGIHPAILLGRYCRPFYDRAELGRGQIAEGRILKDGVWEPGFSRDPFLLNEAQIERISIFFPKHYREIDWRSVSGIIWVMKQGLRWAYADASGSNFLYNRFVLGSRRGVFDRVFHALAQEDLGPDRIVIGIEDLNAQPTAAKLVQAGYFPLLSRGWSMNIK